LVFADGGTQLYEADSGDNTIRKYQMSTPSNCMFTGAGEAGGYFLSTPNNLAMDFNGGFLLMLSLGTTAGGTLSSALINVGGGLPTYADHETVAYASMAVVAAKTIYP
jgi:hypothetical protein